MNGDIEATARQIMSAKQSDAFDEEACEKIIHAACEKAHQAGWLEGRQYQVEYGVAAQPKPESWQEIAREAANRLEAAFHCGPRDVQRFTKIILAAIERSHAAQPKPDDQHPFDAEVCYCGQEVSKHDMSHDIRVMGDHVAQPQDSEIGWVIEKGETHYPKYLTVNRRWDWTHDHLEAIRFARKQDAELVDSHFLLSARSSEHRICEHSWEPAAQPQPSKASPLVERNEFVPDHDSFVPEADQIEMQRKSEQRLLSALAAIDWIRDHVNGYGERPPALFRVEEMCNKVDLSALREHDEKLTAEVREKQRQDDWDELAKLENKIKPLVDALMLCRPFVNHWLKNEIDALTKQKP